MASTKVSIDIEQEDLAVFEALFELTDLSRSALVRSLLLRGMKERRLEEAAKAYRRNAATLSRAAEIAGLSVRDFLARMEEESLELHYGTEDLEADLASLSKA